jgi:PhnB protein
MAFLPYLNFGGTCREAFTRYQEIFGGELFVQTMGEMPADEPVPPGMEDFVIHAALTLPDGLLMASDAQPGTEFGPVHGMYVNYTVADMAEAERVYGALAEGGTVEMPFGETFWSPGFGICVDRFGTPWMVNVEHAAEG